jgi:hypothetical protein
MVKSKTFQNQSKVENDYLNEKQFEFQNMFAFQV